MNRRALQVGRPLINNFEFVDWAARCLGSENVFKSPHVTIAYSRSPVDWDAKVFQADSEPLEVIDGSRSLEIFKGGVLVLTFECPGLTQRWNEMIVSGASWNFQSYTPHITLGIAPQGYSTSKFIPFSGDLRLGPEYRKPIK